MAGRCFPLWSTRELNHQGGRYTRRLRPGGSQRSLQAEARWLVDITTNLPLGEELAGEYDGAYWRADKLDFGHGEESLDLLAAGFRVVRLREHPLPPLPVFHERYRELVVHAAAPNPERAMAQVQAWMG